jgi:hypothetical protein
MALLAGTWRYLFLCLHLARLSDPWAHRPRWDSAGKQISAGRIPLDMAADYGLHQWSGTFVWDTFRDAIFRHNHARNTAHIKPFPFAQFSALAITYRVCQTSLGRKVMKNFTGLMQRLLEIQSGERQRSPELIAEDERLIDGLRKRASTLQTVNAGKDGSERG